MNKDWRKRIETTEFGFDADPKAIEGLINDIKQQLLTEIEKMKKTTGIKGILGTTHRDGVVNEGFNQALDKVKEKVREM